MDSAGYHAISDGHLLGELVRRVAHKSLRQCIADEITDPLSADFQIGAAQTSRHRIAEITPPPPIPFDLESLDHASPA